MGGNDCISSSSPIHSSDCLVSGIYNWLWRKNKEGVACQGIRIPRTLILEGGRISAWYFTSRSDHQLKRKNKVNLTCKAAQHEFMRKKSANCFGIDAWCSTARADAPNKIPCDPKIAYLGALDVYKCLVDPRVLPDGILQEFIPPIDSCTDDCVIQATWSPRVCLIERRMVRPSDASSSTMLESKSQSAPIKGTALSTKIQHLCNSIVDHINDVGSPQAVRRIVLTFKVDERNRIWFLSCQSILLSPGLHVQSPVPAVPPSQERKLSRLCQEKNVNRDQSDCRARPKRATSRDSTACEQRNRTPTKPPTKRLLKNRARMSLCERENDTSEPDALGIRKERDFDAVATISLTGVTSNSASLVPSSPFNSDQENQKPAHQAPPALQENTSPLLKGQEGSSTHAGQPLNGGPNQGGGEPCPQEEEKASPELIAVRKISGELLKRAMKQMSLQKGDGQKHGNAFYF